MNKFGIISFCVNFSTKELCLTRVFITARIRRMTGGYIFSLSTLGGVPDPALDGGRGTQPSLGWGGTQSSLGWGGYPIQPWMGGYPNLGWGVPHPMSRGGGGYPNLGRGVPHPMSGGVTPGTTPPHRNSKHLLRLRGGRCASCVHAGGLSCSIYFLSDDFTIEQDILSQSKLSMIMQAYLQIQSKLGTHIKYTNTMEVCI